MPNQPDKNRPRVTFICDRALAQRLQEEADSASRSRSNYIEKLLEDSINSNGLSKDETIDQIKKYLALLLGDRDRNGISYSLLGEALGIDPKRLHQLTKLIKKCREQKIHD